jgi:hypothetical protein
LNPRREVDDQLALGLAKNRSHALIEVEDELTSGLHASMVCQAAVASSSAVARTSLSITKESDHGGSFRQEEI